MDQVDPIYDMLDLVRLQVTDEMPPDVRREQVLPLFQQLLDKILAQIKDSRIDGLAYPDRVDGLRDGDESDIPGVSSDTLAGSGNPAAYRIDILSDHRAMEHEIYLILEQKSMTGDLRGSIIT
jgi:hypothetical protein